jgi:hypothetical protein
MHEADESTKTCEECVAGKYSEVGANSVAGCLACKTGEFSQPGAANCNRCGLGEEYVAELNNCETCDVGFASLGDTACVRCEGDKDYSDEPKQAVCKQSAPGEMPNADNTGVMDCPAGTYLEGCVCPKNTYLTLDGELCAEFADEFKGVDLSEAGMKLETLRVLPGYWRTDNRSSDVRPCPVAEACVGWETGNCREGHVGPYCNLCDDGYERCFTAPSPLPMSNSSFRYAPDAFLLCQECKAMASTLAVGAGLMVAGALLLWCVLALLNKLVFAKRPELRRRLKTGLKILFVGAQILAVLPATIPAIELPENYKQSLETLQPFNLNVFQMAGVGCFSGGWNLHWSLLATTATPLVLIGLAVAFKRKGSAVAIAYLVLPTVTTTIFKVFPCDELDNGTEFLHADYSLR